MRPIKANEWADLALKKDAETIKRRMLSKQFVILLICVDISLAGFSTLVGCYNFINLALKIFLYILIFAPLVCPIIALIKYLANIIKVGRGKFNTKEYVDIFDNSICYWAMMSSSFLDNINSAKAMPSAEKVFCIQEINYYINKSIKEINHISLHLSAIICDNYEEAYNKHKISLSRLILLINLLISLRIRSNKIFHSIKNEIDLEYEISNAKGDNLAETVNLDQWKHVKYITIINDEEEYNKKMNDVLDGIINNIQLDFGVQLKNMSDHIAQISDKTEV